MVFFPCLNKALCMYVCMYVIKQRQVLWKDVMDLLRCYQPVMYSMTNIPSTMKQGCATSMTFRNEDVLVREALEKKMAVPDNELLLPGPLELDAMSFVCFFLEERVCGDLKLTRTRLSICVSASSVFCWASLVPLRRMFFYLYVVDGGKSF